MTISVKEYRLCETAIDEIAEGIVDYCLSRKCDKKSALRARVNAEEVLLHFLENGYRDKETVVKFGKNFKNAKIQIAVEGDAYNPLERKCDEYGNIIKGYYVFTNMLPIWHHKNDFNYFEYTVPKKPKSQLFKLITVLAAAVIVGIFGRFLLPAGAVELCTEKLFPPIYNLYFSLLGCVAGPMIFISVACGIYGIGDSSLFGTVGKKVLVGSVLISFFGAATALLFLPFSGLTFVSGSGDVTQFDSIIEMILSIFPKNVVEPFSTGNTLQIIVMAVVIGIALLFLGRKTETVATVLEQLNYLIEYIMSFIGKLIPIAVFFVLVKLIWSDNLSVFKDMWKLYAAVLILFALYMLIYTVITALRTKINVFKLIKNLLPVYVVALATASSAASLSTITEICEKKLGINKSFTGFGVPLGAVIEKPAALFVMLFMLYASKSYGVDISIFWIITMLVSVTLCSCACPPIPGGGATIFTVLIAQAGLPTEVLGIVFSVEIIQDFLNTSFNMYCVPLSLLNISSSLGLVNKEILYKYNK